MKLPVHKLVALLLVLNYIAFHAEFFDKENEQNHRLVSSTCSIDTPSVTWETFDKTNAPKAFVFDAEVTFQIVDCTPQIISSCFVHRVNDNVIRDKSPPISISFSS